MAKLFGRDRSAITRYINNNFNDDELKKGGICKICTYHKNGAIYNKTQTREFEYYNLDLIISVGY